MGPVPLRRGAIDDHSIVSVLMAAGCLVQPHERERTGGDCFFSLATWWTSTIRSCARGTELVPHLHGLDREQWRTLQHHVVNGNGDDHDQAGAGSGAHRSGPRGNAASVSASARIRSRHERTVTGIRRPRSVTVQSVPCPSARTRTERSPSVSRAMPCGASTQSSRQPSAGIDRLAVDAGLEVAHSRSASRRPSSPHAEPPGRGRRPARAVVARGARPSRPARPVRASSSPRGGPFAHRSAIRRRCRTRRRRTRGRPPASAGSRHRSGGRR